MIGSGSRSSTRNVILDDLNPRMPQLRNDIAQTAALADVYADASPDLWSGLDNAVSTARTLNDERANVDAALMAAVGFGNTGRRQLRTRRAVPGARRRRLAADVASCSTTTAA